MCIGWIRTAMGWRVSRCHERPLDVAAGRLAIKVKEPPVFKAGGSFIGGGSRPCGPGCGNYTIVKNVSK